MLLLNWFDRAGAVRHRGQVHHGGKNVLTTRNLTGPDTMHTPAADLVRKGWIQAALTPQATEVTKTLPSRRDANRPASRCASPKLRHRPK